MTKLAAITIILLVFYVGVRYCLKLLRGGIAPRFATWLIFEVGVAMSLASYLAGSDHSLTKAALNVADCIQVTVVLAAIMIGQKGRTRQFTLNERLSLWLSGAVTIAWLLTKTGWIGFVGFQMVMAIAYLPTLESLWRWKPGIPPEPMDKWGVNIVIALLGLFVDVTGRHDYLAMVYPLRALILCVLVVALILRWNQKSRSHSAACCEIRMSDEKRPSGQLQRRRQQRGKVQEGGTASCRAADERRSAERDEGSGETEGVSPGAI